MLTNELQRVLLCNINKSSILEHSKKIHIKLHSLTFKII